jgi:N-acetylmuramoyl-L-alanine amidase
MQYLTGERRILLRKKIALTISSALLSIALLMLLNTYRTDIQDYIGYSQAALSYYGSRGQEVTEIQKRLSWWGYYDGAVDGIYGYLTYKAVREFQYKNGLVVDGIAGPETLSALGLPTGKTTASRPASASNNDLNLLAHIIHGEAEDMVNAIFLRNNILLSPVRYCIKYFL